jgi:hypothetical protein
MGDDYSALDRLLHRVVLGHRWMGEVLFDLDGLSAGKIGEASQAPVYVTGLARAGTTILMRALHGSGMFASLTYADMPMVMAPNFWAKFSRASRKDRVARERAHGDGIMVDFDAPEALEEVFWRSYCGSDYITTDSLIPHNPSDEVIEAYRVYQRRICHRYRAPRYLAKNNNLMLRLLPLARAIPDAAFLVAVRDPLAQAASLRNQHARFSGADRFVRSYMTWLAHHEFGADHRPYRLPGQPVPSGDPDTIDYWLSLWAACYGYLADRIAEGPGNIHIVVYERLCEDPAAWEEIAGLVGIARTDAGFRRVDTRAETAADADPALLAHARDLYDRLRGTSERRSRAPAGHGSQETSRDGSARNIGVLSKQA